MHWTPDSWQTKDAAQQPVYPDLDALAAAVQAISKLPPLVTTLEVQALKKQLAEAAAGRAFVLQGGDCAESFEDCEPTAITSKLKVLLQMSLVLVHAARRPIVRVGRIAGQYAKPRSSYSERRGDQTLPAYRGDNVNRCGFTSAERQPDPQLLIRGYEKAALTLNFIRALAAGGFADLHHPEYWDLDFLEHSDLSAEYKGVVQQIRETLEFMEAITGASFDDVNRIEFYTSHEGLSLNYEQAQTRQTSLSAGWYNLSTHFPWIGMRTAAVDGAHVEYFRGIRNPIAVKVGPEMDEAWLLELVDILHPDNEPGRLTLTHRFGVDQIEDKLPPLIEAVRRTGKTVLWCADPMHGNTETTEDGVKTRHLSKIYGELVKAFDIHAELGSHLGGLHFELTGENVTECIGGARGLEAQDLGQDYRSRVDPRLNYEQALEIAMLVARKVKDLDRKKNGG